MREDSVEIVEADLDARLRAAPRDINALVLKGIARERAGDERVAASFYRAALRAAVADGVPHHLVPLVEHAQHRLAVAGARFEAYLERALAEAGLPRDARPPRFAESLEIMSGRLQPRMELQRPGGYYYPGLPQRRYYERAEFPWAAKVEREIATIRSELQALLAHAPGRFVPYMAHDPNRPLHDFHGMVDNPAWSTLYLWQDGRAVDENVALCPRTFELIQGLDLPRITRRAPSILFSRLSPGAHIPPHTGVLNTRLICHLPLIVPAGCGFRVGGELREWREGELLVFDDTVEHEAWNHADSDRVVLIFDVWRPELDEDERRAVVALFEAVDGYRAGG